ncbi:MAG TPA: hypothetical protein VGL61_10815 [Kofleriaceae bacterium]|jgi:hypothetical protein
MRVAVALLVVAACGNGESLPIDAQCNPLGINHCMTPWPNAVFEVDDSTTATGRHLAIPDTTLPTNVTNDQIDPTEWNWADGFSPSAPMVMSFPNGVSVAGLPPVDNMDLSLAPDSPTVILDMTTGERVAHFAEVDMQATGSAGSQALFLRPAQRLTGGHRYAVAITKAVKGADGNDLPIPPGFAALRDGKHTDHALLEAERPRFAAVLEALDSAGYPADDLVVAWEFTVASDDFIHQDMIAARDAAVAALDNHTIQFTITKDSGSGSGSAATTRIIEGTLDAPLFLTDGGDAVMQPVVARDSNNLPMMQGWYQIPFAAIVPPCAYSSPTPVGMVIYGHGLMGAATEVEGGTQQTTASSLCMVFAATDLRGMSTQDLAAVATALNDGTHADQVMEVLEQGLVNQVTLVRALRTTFAQTLFVDANNGNKVLVDPTNVVYYGLSQGGIFGTSIMAYDPTLTLGVLGVGAANYSMLLDRSSDWPTYRSILSAAYPDSLDDTMLLSLFQMRWDKTEGAGIVNSVLAGSPTSPQPKQLLMQIALSDNQVPNIGSYWQARSMGIPVIGPTPVTPWGLTVQQTPITTGSAMIIMDGGAPPAPATNVPAPAQNPSMHDLTRTQPATWRQMHDFYTTGMIVNECAGACECQSGACN